MNQSVRVPKFKQEGIKAVATQVQEGDKFVSVDLENGFHYVSMHPDSWTYFGMYWNNHFYVWCVLPFGCSASPYLFKKVLEPVTRFLRMEFSMRLALFVDDFFQMSRVCEATSKRDNLVHMLQDLGWKINETKSQLEPSDQCTFVGFDVYSIGANGPWIKVLAVKVKKLRCYLRRVLHNEYVSARMLAKIEGQCVAMTRAVMPGELLLRSVYRCLAKRTSWSDLLLIDDVTRRDLNWWDEAIANWNGAPLHLRNPEVQLISDASGTGYGAWIPGLNVEMSGVTSKALATEHSNFKELLTILIGIQSFREELKGKCIQVLTDNITAVAYLNKMGGPSAKLSQIAKDVFMECQDLQVSLQVQHLSGSRNQK